MWFLKYSTVCDFSDIDCVFFCSTSRVVDLSSLTGSLDRWTGGLTQDLPIGHVSPDAMNDRKAELPLGEVFGETFVIGVFGGLEVHVVVPDLEED